MSKHKKEIRMLEALGLDVKEIKRVFGMIEFAQKAGMKFDRKLLETIPKCNREWIESVLTQANLLAD